MIQIVIINNNWMSFYDILNNQGLGKCKQPRSEAEADYTCRDLDYSGYHKNRIQLLFYYSYGFMENIQKLLCEMQVDFICALLVLYKDKRTKKPHQSQTFTCSRSLAKGA